MANGSRSSAATASATLPKLSSTYCAQSEMASPGLLPRCCGYSDSTSHSRLATRPFSFMPSVVDTS